MNCKSAQLNRSIALSFLIVLAIGLGYMDSRAADAALAKATFYVY
jgi:hypothetical protein